VPDYLRRALLDPEADIADNFGQYRWVITIPDNFVQVRAVTRDGREIRGAASEPVAWLTYSGSYSGQRHSALRQITPANVAGLKPVGSTRPTKLPSLPATPCSFSGSDARAFCPIIDMDWSVGRNVDMRRMLPGIAIALCAHWAFAADAPQPGVNKIFDRDLTTIEREIVPLAEALPADKYDFAPKGGEFKGVRTFGQQMKHAAAVIYMVSASVLGEKNPDTGGSEAGPESVKTKEQIVKYLKDSFAYGHKAMNSLTAANLAGMVNSAFGGNQVPRVSMATVAVWHTFDHYGQAVVYARMNGVIPPASRK
jgi:DinB family protein